MKRRELLLGSLALLSFPEWGNTTVGARPMGEIRRAAPEPTTHQRQLRFTLAISNRSGTELRDRNVWFYLPMTETATQRIAAVRISEPYPVLRDGRGHEILHLDFPTFPRFGSKTISVVIDLETSEEPRTIASENPTDWLMSELFIESDEPSVQALAAKLLARAPWETARAIYEWVAANIAYAGYVAEDRGALDALKHKRGDCTEYAYLAVALARACKIPARVIGGYVTDRNLAPRPESFHNWAEFYLSGAWRLVDAQKKNWLTPSEDYIAFQVVKENLQNPIGRAHRARVDDGLRLDFNL